MSSLQISSGNTAGATTNITSGGITLVGGNNITLSQTNQIITISGPNVPAATNFSLNGTSSSVSISAGANIGIGQAASTITISASSYSTLVSIDSITAGGATSGTANTVSSSAFVFAAGSNITLSQLSTSPEITIIGAAGGGGGASVLTTISSTLGGATSGTVNSVSSTAFGLYAGTNITLSQNSTSPNITIQGGGLTAVSYTENFPLAQAVSFTSYAAANVSAISSLFLQRILIPASMNLSEVDIALSMGFNATSNGAGTLSQSFILYTLQGSTGLGSLISASGSSAWTTGTSTAAGSVSLTQFQGGWSIQKINPMTFASSTVAPGEYVAGNMISFAMVSSSATVRLYARVDSFPAALATVFTAAPVTAAVSSTNTLTTATVISASATAGMALLTGGTIPSFAYIGTGSSTGTNAAIPGNFVGGILSTNAVPVAITLTTASLTMTGTARNAPIWFCMVGS